jgi:hypothetical protein
MGDTGYKALAKLESWRVRHSVVLLRSMVCALSAIAIVWLGYELWRFIAQPAYLFGHPIKIGAIDLNMRFVEVTDWFNRTPVYEIHKNAIYPPASYVMFYPLFMWPTLVWAKTVWLIILIFLGNYVPSETPYDPVPKGAL